MSAVVSTEQFIKVLRQFLNTLKAREGCKHCPEKHPACLDFHHRDGELKEFTVSQLVHRRSWMLIHAEIAKCDVVCSNCHRKRHYEEETGAWRTGGPVNPVRVARRPVPRIRAIDQMVALVAAHGPKTVREIATSLNLKANHVRMVVCRNPSLLQRTARGITIRTQ